MKEKQRNKNLEIILKSNIKVIKCPVLSCVAVQCVQTYIWNKTFRKMTPLKLSLYIILLPHPHTQKSSLG